MPKDELEVTRVDDPEVNKVVYIQRYDDIIANVKLAMMRLDHASKGLEEMEHDIGGESYMDLELDRLTVDLAELSEECGQASKELSDKRKKFMAVTDDDVSHIA